MRAGAGRSSYIPEDEIKGIPDPGAMTVSLWLGAVADCFAKQASLHLEGEDS